TGKRRKWQHWTTRSVRRLTRREIANFGYNTQQALSFFQDGRDYATQNIDPDVDDATRTAIQK
ncbi:MAG: hypothetical protein MK364_23795, partial [Pirellulales bacterium]|nr:hypothetical protein [Pirellulales bacterium]